MRHCPCWAKQETLLGKGHPSGEHKGIQEDCSATGSCGLPRVWYGGHSQVCLWLNHLIRVLTDSALIVAKMVASKNNSWEVEGRVVFLWPFPYSSDWWWLTRSVFLPRTFCHNITHVNGYSCEYLARLGGFSQGASPKSPGRPTCYGTTKPKRNYCSEKPTHCNSESGPCSLQQRKEKHKHVHSNEDSA